MKQRSENRLLVVSQKSSFESDDCEIIGQVVFVSKHFNHINEYYGPKTSYSITAILNNLVRSSSDLSVV